jgi:hypothetical protein
MMTDDSRFQLGKTAFEALAENAVDVFLIADSQLDISLHRK